MVKKLRNEVRDAVHGLIEFNDLEKRLIDSAPVQRLRSIHQLAMCYQVYPGATHKRFEHSLGVMDLVGRIFDRVFDERSMSGGVRERLKEYLEPEVLGYWKQVLRVAALLHDVGHLPFSHAAEKDLLPNGWNHERITAHIIRESEIASILSTAPRRLDSGDVVSIAWEPREHLKVEPETILAPWQTLLGEIISGNTFGADRMDYLLRDSLHAGVVYGRFDPSHLISALRLVIDPATDDVTLGLDLGGIHSAEALLLARYFMYTQVYFHDVRRAYDLHLKDFLKAWLPDGGFTADWREVIRFTDNEVLAALREASSDNTSKLHRISARVQNRQHFRTVYELLPTEKNRRPTILEDLLGFALEQFGGDNIAVDGYLPRSEPISFPVLTESEKVENSLRISRVIANIPNVELGLIFAAPDIKDKASEAIRTQAEKLLAEAASNELQKAFVHSSND